MSKKRKKNSFRPSTLPVIEKSQVAFHSPNRSLGRARKHIDDLEAAIIAFNEEGRAYTIVENTYDKGRKYAVKARQNKAIPDEFESIAIDAIYNLRACLDQAIYAVGMMANKIRGSTVSLDKISFPIRDTKGEVEDWVRGHCKSGMLPIEIGTDILKFSPFYNGSAIDSVLYALHQAAITNKHRILTPTEIRLGRIYYKHVCGPETIIGPKETYLSLGGADTITNSMGGAPIRDDEIGLYFGNTAQRTKYDVEITIDIKFSKIKGMKGRSCVYQLRKISDICEKIIWEFTDTSKTLRLCK